MTKPTKWPCAKWRLRSAMGIRRVWSESSLCAQWVAKDQNFLHVDSEDSDQTGRMPGLIWVFAWRTYYFVDFVIRRLKYKMCDVKLRKANSSKTRCVVGHGWRHTFGYILRLIGWDLMLCLLSGPTGFNYWVHQLQRFRVGLVVDYSSCFISTMNLDLYLRCLMH